MIQKTENENSEEFEDFIQRINAIALDILEGRTEYYDAIHELRATYDNEPLSHGLGPLYTRQALAYRNIKQTREHIEESINNIFSTENCANTPLEVRVKQKNLMKEIYKNTISEEKGEHILNMSELSETYVDTLFHTAYCLHNYDAEKSYFPIREELPKKARAYHKSHGEKELREIISGKYAENKFGSIIDSLIELYELHIEEHIVPRPEPVEGCKGK